MEKAKLVLVFLNFEQKALILRKCLVTLLGLLGLLFSNEVFSLKIYPSSCDSHLERIRSSYFYDPRLQLYVRPNEFCGCNCPGGTDIDGTNYKTCRFDIWANYDGTIYPWGGTTLPGSSGEFCYTQYEYANNAAIIPPTNGPSLGSPNTPDTQPSHSPLAGGTGLKGGSCSNDIPGQHCGNPINNTTGNRFETEADYQGTGVFPLGFERYYNSLGQESGGFGAHWTHSYSAAVKRVSNTQVDVIRPDQKVLTFQLSNGVWRTTADINGTLSQTGGQWLYRTGDDQLETYEASGRLLSIANRNGVRQTLTYDALGRLAAVADPYGKSLTFSYDAANRIVGMTDPGSGSYSYGYDANNQLVSVRYPDAATRQYQYANVAPDGSEAIIVMKALIDELGKTYASWTYDSDGTAKSSQHAGGADAVNLSRFRSCLAKRIPLKSTTFV